MRVSRSLVVTVVFALVALASTVLGKPLGDSSLRPEPAAPPSIVLAAAGHDISAQSRDPSPRGPIPCWDGSTVDFGQICPPLTIQCANGATVPFGQFCPLTSPSTTSTPAPPPPITCPDGSTVPTGQQCPAPKPAPCPIAGQYRDSNGLCYCPSGQFVNSAGTRCEGEIVKSWDRPRSPPPLLRS